MHADLARYCGLDVAASVWFDMLPKLAASCVTRFDREQGLRVPMHSQAGLPQEGLHEPDRRTDGPASHRCLRRLVSEGGLPLQATEATIDGMLEQAATFAGRATARPIRRATVQQMKTVVDACRKRLA